MAYQYGVLLRNAKLNSINVNLGATATLKIFSGAEPVNCAAADPVGLLVTINLPSTPFNPASNGVITLFGLWEALAANSGIAASFRIYDSLGNCAIQGNCTADLILNSVDVTIGKTVTVVSYTTTSGNS